MSTKVDKIKDFISTSYYISNKYDTIKSQEESKITKDTRLIRTVITESIGELDTFKMVDDFFAKFYQRYSRVMLLSPFCDNWLRKTGPKIVFNEKKKTGIAVGIIYNNSVSIKEAYEDDVASYRESDYEFLMLPIRYLYSLYDLGKEYIDDPKMDIYLSQLRFVIENKPPESGDSIVSSIKKFCQGMGIDVSGIPDDFNISDLMNKDGPAKELLAPLMSEIPKLMKGGADSKQSLQNLMKSLNNAEGLPPQLKDLMGSMNINDMMSQMQIKNPSSE